MAQIRTVTDSLSVAGQVRPDEVPDLARRFSLIINNRPDGEEPDQPAASEIEAAARDAGVQYAFIPVRGAPTAEQVQAVRTAMAGTRGPVLAFCKTGTRSITTWALGEGLADAPVEELENRGREAGYDLGPALQSLLPRLRAEQAAG
jgi:uncharacterized protein (TIGR01244 family)